MRWYLVEADYNSICRNVRRGPAGWAAPLAGRRGWCTSPPSAGQWVRPEAWSWPVWEYWHHRNQQTRRTKTLVACFVFSSQTASRLTFTSTAQRCVECCLLCRNTSECWGKARIWEVKEGRERETWPCHMLFYLLVEIFSLWVSMTDVPVWEG